MSWEETGSGLLVRVAFPKSTDGTSEPRDVLPNDNGAGPNDPPVSVGPTSSEGFGNTHVMYPDWMASIDVQAWSGWPVGWATPLWNNGSGLDALVAKVSTAWACLDLNANVLATMPPYIVKGTVPQDATTWITNPQPEVYTSWEEFAKQLFLAFQLGEVFVWATARYANGYPARFMCLRSDWVNVEMVDGLRRISLGGEDITADCLHIRYTSFPGDARGHGPLEAAVYSLMGAAALEKYACDLANRGGIPWAVMTHPDELSDVQVTDLQNRWIQARLRAMGAPAILSGGIELTPLTLSPKDMALLELRQFDESRVAVLLGVPPEMVGLPSGHGSLTYRNVEGIYDFHWRAGLRPKAQTVMAALSNWLLPAGTGVELNRDEYVRPPFNDRMAGYAVAHNIVDPVTGERAITVAEIRQLERMQPPTGAPALSGGG